MDGFTRLATGGCPPLADLLLALAAEFRDVDAAAADARLDELALPLFGLAGGDLRAAAARLATLLDTDPGFDADRASVAGLWLDSVLEARAGHPLVLAALTAEVGRRAGLPTHVLSAPTGWYAARGRRDRRAGCAMRPTASACGSSTPRWTVAVRTRGACAATAPTRSASPR